MQLYANPNDPDHAANNAAFIRVVNEFPDLPLFQPSPQKAPWHWQAYVDAGGDVQVLNFWPHRLKGQRDGCLSVEGEDELRRIIKEAFEDALEEPFDVIEG